MSDALWPRRRMALAREQKLNDLGGLVVAAARTHDLGTPLATIKVAQCGIGVL